MTTGLKILWAVALVLFIVFYVRAIYLQGKDRELGQEIGEALKKKIEEGPIMANYMQRSE